MPALPDLSNIYSPMMQVADVMTNTAKRLTDPLTRAGSIALLFDVIGHSERDEVTIEKATIDYDVNNALRPDLASSQPTYGPRFQIRLVARDNAISETA